MNDTVITIEKAIEMIVSSNNNMPPYYEIEGFDINKCEYVDGWYNHNYYKYKGTIILEDDDDDVTNTYYVCDKDRNIIGCLGNRFIEDRAGSIWTTW